MKVSVLHFQPFSHSPSKHRRVVWFSCISRFVSHFRFIHLACPFLLLHIGLQFSSDVIADGPLKLLSANVTSLRKNWDIIRRFDADIVCFQETILNKQGQNSMARCVSKSSRRVIFGKPCDYKFNGSQPEFLFGMLDRVGLPLFAKFLCRSKISLRQHFPSK